MALPRFPHGLGSRTSRLLIAMAAIAAFAEPGYSQLQVDGPTLTAARIAVAPAALPEAAPAEISLQNTGPYAPSLISVGDDDEPEPDFWRYVGKGFAAGALIGLGAGLLMQKAAGCEAMVFFPLSTVPLGALAGGLLGAVIWVGEGATRPVR